MITFKTESGSVYEVKPTRGPKIRRVSGKNAPTERQTAGWRQYQALIPAIPTVGQTVLIHWKYNEDGSMNCTMTSRVTEVTHA